MLCFRVLKRDWRRTMKNAQLVLVVGLVVSLLLGYQLGLTQERSPKNSTKESTYARVLRTGEIRCAYEPYAPALMKDPNTGEFSGIFYEIMTEVARRLNVKMNWVEEVGYGVI